MSVFLSHPDDENYERTFLNKKKSFLVVFCYCIVIILIPTPHPPLPPPSAFIHQSLCGILQVCLYSFSIFCRFFLPSPPPHKWIERDKDDRGRNFIKIDEEGRFEWSQEVNSYCFFVVLFH